MFIRDTTVSIKSVRRMIHLDANLLVAALQIVNHES